MKEGGNRKRGVVSAFKTVTFRKLRAAAVTISLNPGNEETDWTARPQSIRSAVVSSLTLLCSADGGASQELGHNLSGLSSNREDDHISFFLHI